MLWRTFGSFLDINPVQLSDICLLSSRSCLFKLWTLDFVFPQAMLCSSAILIYNRKHIMTRYASALASELWCDSLVQKVQKPEVIQSLDSVLKRLQRHRCRHMWGSYCGMQCLISSRHNRGCVPATNTQLWLIYSSSIFPEIPRIKCCSQITSDLVFVQLSSAFCRAIIIPVFLKMGS